MFDQLKSNTDRAIESYVRLSARRPYLILSLLLAVTALLSLGVPRITLHTRIEALLPDHTVSQLSNDEASRRYAGSSPFFLVVQSSNPAMNREVTSRALLEVQKWPETHWAIDSRDPRYFLDRRLLFVDEKVLGEFADDVDAYVGFRKCEKMPGCIQLADEPEQPSFDRLQEQLKSQPEVQSLSALLGESALDQAVTQTSNGEKAEEHDGKLCSKDGQVCVVQVALDREPTDLEYARRMVDRGEKLLKKLTPEGAPADTITSVSGIYRNLPLTRAELMRDLERTFLLGVGLIVLVIMLQFRRIRAIPLLFIPLAIGSVWSLGIFAWISPELNLISAAGFIILAGLGIDFGLHLLTHYGAERQEGHTPEESVLKTLLELFSQLFVAALTTAFGFAALMAAQFRGFAQLGEFATIGIFSTLAATVLTFPPLVLGLQKLRPREGAFTRDWKLPLFFSQGFARPTAMAITLVGLAAFAGSLALLPKISLRYDLSSLIDQAAADGTRFRDAVPGTSRGAVLLLADDPASLEAAASGLRQRFPSGLSEPEGHGSKKGEKAKGAPVITPGTFLPIDQEKKLEHIEILADAAEDALKYGDADWKEKLEPWLPLLEVNKPVVKDDLPTWVLDSLKERDGTFGTIGLTYQDYPGTHAGKMLELSHKLDKLRADHPHVRFSSSNAILGEVMPMLSQDGWKVTGLALLGLLLATLIIGRSRRRTILILSSIFIAVSMTAAIMVLFDWKIDFYNLLVFPVVFGIGVDGAIYVAWTVLKRGGVFDWNNLPVSARAVFGSTLTTLVVFASLGTSDSGGLASLGQTGTMALFITLVANLVWLPAALSWLNHAVDARRETQSREELSAQG